MIEEKKETETEIVDAESKTPKGLSKLVGLKKHILPASIAAGVFILAIVGSSLLMKKNPATDGETVVPTDEQTKVTKDSTISGKEGTFDSLFTDIDTVEVMKQLDFLFYNPDEKIDSQKAAISKDSVDTLNWIQRETAKLETEKAAIEKQKKELDALDSKVNQGLVKINQAESARIIILARLYDGMRPDEVVKLCENLDDTIIVAIIPRMKPANAAKLLALLPPKRAAGISTQLITIAGR